MDVSAAKKALRRSIRERILSLSPGERAQQELGLRQVFPTLPGLDEAQSILLYVRAFPEEVETHDWIDWVVGSGRRLILPRVDRAARCLRLHAVTNLTGDLAAGTLGILEPRPGAPLVSPDAVDWVLVPGLAFDDRGYRLGRGAGYYDRLLPQLRPSVPRWAVAFDPQWVEALPVEPHDVALDGIVSPSRRFTRRTP
ncbi:MAG: 5-formyltetrahydrofolate cyclo-ligase [Isosphaeraceae bacterium]